MDILSETRMTKSIFTPLKEWWMNQIWKVPVFGATGAALPNTPITWNPLFLCNRKQQNTNVRERTEPIKMREWFDFFKKILTNVPCRVILHFKSYLYLSINLNIGLSVVKGAHLVGSSCNLQSTYRNWRKQDKANNFLDDLMVLMVCIPKHAILYVSSSLFDFFLAKPVLYELQHFVQRNSFDLQLKESIFQPSLVLAITIFDFLSMHY